MKKLIISLIASTLLIMSGFSQEYTYTGKKFIQTFEGDQMDKTPIFSWTSTDGKPMSLVDGTLKIENAFQRYNSAKVNFDSTHLDLSEVPYVSVEVKASVDTLIQLNLMDGNGNHTSGQHTMRVNSEWQTFTFNYFEPIGIYGGTDITDIASVAFDRSGYADTDGTLWIKWIAVGDTSYSIITDVEESSAAGEQDITIYPNPVKDEIIVSGIIVEEAIITDLTGNVVMIIEAGNVSSGIDVSGLATGMYIISCKNENGTIQKTFIKE
jgi:hypothetical protein